MSTTKTILGILAGAAVGAAAGILLAPEKGCDTRKKIASNAKDLCDRLKRKTASLASDAENEWDNVKDSAENFAKKAEDKAQSLLNKAEGKVEELSGKAKQALA